MLIKKIYGFVACSAIVCSSGALVSFLTSDNTPIPESTKVEVLEPIVENKSNEFKLDTYRSVDSLVDFGFFDLVDGDLNVIS